MGYENEGRTTYPLRITRRRLIEGGATGALLSGVSIPAAARQHSDDDRSPALSISDRLADRRYVVTGERAYVVGTQAGRFPATGWHTRGEMGGVWSPPIKLLDGIWFGIDGEWLGEATTFERGYGHVSMNVPAREGLAVRRTEFVPEGRRAVLVGLSITADGSDESFTLTADAHSELKAAYPWGWTEPSQEEFNLEDEVAVDGSRLVFRSEGMPPVENADHRDWAAVVGTDREPADHDTGEDFRGPQDPPVVCPADGEEETPSFCDESEFGRGKGGRLRYEVSLEAGETETIWFAIAGSEEGPESALDEFEAAIDDPEGALEAKVDRRRELRERTVLDLPDERLQRAIDWTKQNLADSVLEARDLRIRVTDEGQRYPEPVGELDRIRFLAAGFPDFPWLFAVDGEYTAFTSVALGQFEPIKDHMRAVRDASEIANEGAGKVVHEVVTEGSIYFGHLDDPGNTDETVKFPSAVALIWRWTGDDEFRDEMYDFVRRNMEYVFEELVEEDWPLGQGNVERPGMGEKKLDNAAYTVRGLLDLADMARSKGDDETAEWATARAEELWDAFDETWWIPEVPQHADSLEGEDDVPLHHRHWIGITPLEISIDDRRRLGLSPADRGNAALDLRETECYGGVGAPEDEMGVRTNEGLYHTGAPGCDGEYEHAEDHTERNIYTLNSAVMAVAEGNYGRLGPDRQGRFVDANASLQLPDPDELPGAMPEVAPSPEYGRSIDHPFTDRLMVLQAWGSYGTVWPTVHQRLGVRPDAGRSHLEVVPHVPPDWPGLSGENVRVGDGSVAVAAAADDGVYRTTVRSDADLESLRVGHALPHDADVAVVELDGECVDHRCRDTNRGREIVVEVEPGREHTLVVRTGPETRS